jgi:hypothetical protein
MKKRIVFLLILLLAFPPGALAGQSVSLEGLTALDLEAIRQEADGRIRLMGLPDANGYLDVLDGEAYAREPQTRLDEKIRLNGTILSVQEQAGEYLYYVSLEGNPARVFLVRYALDTDERLLLPGDQVTVYGVFQGLSAFAGADLLKDGAPIVQADLVILQLPEPERLAADPYAGTREDPVPLGVWAVYEGSYWTDYASFEIAITESSRGSEAANAADRMSTYNNAPAKGQEYLLVWLSVKALSAPTGRAEIGNGDFYFVSAAGKEYRQYFLINPPASLGALYEGGEETAVLACLIDKGDTPLIVYQPDAENPLWFNPNPDEEGE